MRSGKTIFSGELIFMGVLLLAGSGCERGTRWEEEVYLQVSEDEQRAEIQAAGELSDAGFKKERLRALAGRQDLGGGAQVFLVQIANQSLADEQDRKEVLAALIRNKHFACAARDAIVVRLNTFNPQARDELEKRLAKKTCQDSASAGEH